MSSSQREMIARIIDPDSWAYRDWKYANGQHPRGDQAVAPSLTKADAILSALPQAGLGESEIHVRWSDDGKHIRKWDWKPFEGATEKWGVNSLISRALADCAPEPVSTPTIGILEALTYARSILANYADPTGYTDRDGEQLSADETLHPGLLAAEAVSKIDAALSAYATAAGKGE